MKTKPKNNRFRRFLLIFVAFLCYSSSMQSSSTSSITLSFDYLFPLSYYQKGLESLMYVWQILAQTYETDTALSFDVLLSKLALAQYAFNCMIQDGEMVIEDDKMYLIIVVNKINDLMNAMVISHENEDFVMCAKEMVSRIQQQVS